MLHVYKLVGHTYRNLLFQCHRGYSLQAVVHSTALVRHDDHWSLCDDVIVTAVSHLMDGMKEYLYVAFYSKVTTYYGGREGPFCA